MYRHNTVCNKSKQPTNHLARQLKFPKHWDFPSQLSTANSVVYAHPCCAHTDHQTAIPSVLPRQ